MPQYPDLNQLQGLTDPFAMLQAGQMAYDANEMARQQAVERALANAKAAQMTPLQVQYQSLLNQDAESRLPSTKAQAILETLKAEQGIANQPRALEEARFNLNTLPESKKQEFLKRLPQTVTELKMIPPEIQGKYVRDQASKFGFDPVALDAYLSNTKDLPSALTKLHEEMSLNAPSNIQAQSQLNSKANAAYEKQMAINETTLSKELLRQEHEKLKLAYTSALKGANQRIESRLVQLRGLPDWETNKAAQQEYADLSAERNANVLKANQVGSELMAGKEITTPEERTREALGKITPLANKPAGQNVQDNVTMDVQTKILQSNKLDPNKYRVIIKDGRYQAVPK